MIAFYGMGLLGSSFVRAMLERGETVHVWNRARARSLTADGAACFDDPADAARGAARIHLALSDDAAVDEVMERAQAGFDPGVVVVDHTTTSRAGTAERVRRWTERGVSFQHAPVFMTPANAREGTGWMLASGDGALFERLEPELSKMTGRVVYLGPEPDRAAAFKLMGNLFFVAMTTGLVEMFSLAKAMGIDAAEAASMFDWLNVGATLPARVRRILAADYERPSWRLAMARKDARLMLEEAGRAGLPLPVLSAIATEMDHRIAQGHARDDWTVLAKDVMGRSRTEPRS